MTTKILNIDEKWSIEYDPNENDRPIRLFRYGETRANYVIDDWSNVQFSMFHALLERDKKINELRKSVREQFYFVIAMPLNKDGNGPCPIPEAHEMTYEVWDWEFNSHESFKFLPDAIDFCNKLNYNLSRI